MSLGMGDDDVLFRRRELRVRKGLTRSPPLLLRSASPSVSTNKGNKGRIKGAEAFMALVSAAPKPALSEVLS